MKKLDYNGLGERDKLVAKWCETNRVDFIEHPSKRSNS